MGTARVMAKKRGPAPKPEERRDQFISFKCKGDYKDWVKDFARKLRTTPAQLIDQALVKYAESQGHGAPPER
jgi:hypothetical protein